MKIGFVINPWAGVGGSVALKGSDGADVRREALARGAVPKANEKARLCIQAFLDNDSSSSITWFSAPGDMGENCLTSHGIPESNIRIQPVEIPGQTEAEQTLAVIQWFQEQGIDLLVFAGGDGTARNVVDALTARIPVIGIPAGVKIHSGVFAVTPHAAGEVLAGIASGELTSISSEEVRDIDESQFRHNKVTTRYYGELLTPTSAEFMQHTKIGGVEDESLVVHEIAEWIAQEMQPDTVYFIGSGQSTAAVMDVLDLPNTLLGVDAVLDGKVIKADCMERDILELQKNHSCVFVLSIIGGQGHVFGRGNAQISAQVLANTTKDHFMFIGTKAKLKTLDGRPLLIDTGDRTIDVKWAGLLELLTGYNETLIYPMVAR